MIVAILLISFVLEGIVTNIIPLDSLFIPMFSAVAILVAYPLFNDDKIKFIIYSGFLGLFYDLTYTSTPFINTFSFLLTALIISLICKFITINKLNLILIVVFTVLFHETTTYILLCLFRYRIFNDETLTKGLYSSIIINVLYSYILYFIIEFICKKKKRKYIK